MRIDGEIKISPSSAVLNGHTIEIDAKGDLLVALYRKYVGDYPKFFKMDTLSRLGFIATELLLQDEGLPRFTDNITRAVILANRSASLQNDKEFIATIDESRYYPSPALFVYTLPNIVTGEIAIRNHYKAETSFYILPEEEALKMIVETTFACSPQLRSAIVGWVECEDKQNFYAKIQIVWNT